MWHQEGREMLPAARDQEDHSQCGRDMSVGTKSTESMKKREAKFLGAREQKHTKPLAACESNNVASHSFPGLSKEWRLWWRSKERRSLRYR